MIGHATFCIVVVYNNVIARLRRTPTSLIEASMDLGADGWQTFRYVTFPAIRTALVAGALLAFALSFDEIVVTNFTAGATDTIPRFIYRNLRLPHNRPIVNVVALGVILVSFIPVYVAQRMAGGADVTARRCERAGGGGLTSVRGTGPGTDPAPGAWGRWSPGSPRRRSSSNCARAAICCEKSAAWIPWNRPSSHPTSCA